MTALNVATPSTSRGARDVLERESERRREYPGDGEPEEASARTPMRTVTRIVGMASAPIAGAKGGELLSARASGR
jgi:hypothetical protein